MRTVNISDLKAQLSAHIQFVRDGEEVLVCDRNQPVARIVPCRLEGHSDRERRLIARGILTLPLNKRSTSIAWPEPPGDISDDVMEQVWREERENRWDGFRLSGIRAPWFLSVRQSVTLRAIALYQTYDAVVWWATPVEIASALARLLRMKQLNSGEWSKASRLAKKLSDSWSMIQPSDALRAMSIQLVDRYDLRAADSFQLAAALEWCEYAPQNFVFLTADQRLRDAALLAGFDAKPM